MGIFRSVSGMLEVELTSADREEALRQMNSAGVTVYQVVETGPLGLRFFVSRTDLALLRSVTERRGDSLRYSTGKGLYRSGKLLMGRPVLFLGIIVLLLSTIFLPTRIFFVEVEGTSSVPHQKILSEAVESGIRFSASRRDIRSEQVKNMLLEAIPELQWVGVNTYGCRAVISVRERTQQEETTPSQGIASIVAARDGVIGEMTVTKGSAVCSPGTSVTKGQVIISGYSDLGLCVRGEVAQGEVFAETERDLTVIAPTKYMKKAVQVRSSKKYSLILGKKRIFFFKGSGISDTSCDKMYSEHYVTLPGGFRLPVALGVEETVEYTSIEETMDIETTERMLRQRADSYLTSWMISGKILDREETVTEGDGFHISQGKYHCYEMIGITRFEENIGYYEADRTERERRES